MDKAIAEIPNFTQLASDLMGRVVVEIELVNPVDEAFANLGTLKPSEIRRIKLQALVDTGATMLSIPEDEIAKLGLPVMREAVTRFANGQKAIRKIYGPAVIHVMGRNEAVSVLAGRPGMPALLGQIPLEGLDLWVDTRKQRLIPGHAESPDMQVVEVY